MSTERPLRDLLSGLSREIHTLAAQTVALAGAELKAARVALTSGAILCGVGLVIVVAGALSLLSALVLAAVAVGMPPWVAAIVVGVVLAAAGGGTVMVGLGRVRSAELSLRETRAAVAETLQWLKTVATR